MGEDADGLFAASDGLGLKSGDRVWRVNRAAARDRDEAASALEAAAPPQRSWIIARRGLETLALTGPGTPAPPDAVRGARELSAREKALAAARAARDEAAARSALAAEPALDWTLRADQALWVRFPGGLRAGLKPGDEVQAETSAGLTADASLDFLAIPPGSRVWARVLAVSDDGAIRTARLVFYKLRLSGGGAYPAVGAAVSLADVPAPELAGVSSGGTIVVAAPLPAARGAGKDLLLDASARLRVRLLDAVTLSESPSWWRAGPGLWLKTATDASGRRRFQVTHAVAGRSAAAAGLKVGDLLDSVAGRSSERLDFEEALDALYGPPGSTVKLSVVRPGGSTALALTRGVSIDAKGASAPLPLPFEAR
jgi:hypothetical protein